MTSGRSCSEAVRPPVRAAPARPGAREMRRPDRRCRARRAARPARVGAGRRRHDDRQIRPRLERAIDQILRVGALRLSFRTARRATRRGPGSAARSRRPRATPKRPAGDPGTRAKRSSASASASPARSRPDLEHAARDDARQARARAARAACARTRTADRGAADPAPRPGGWRRRARGTRPAPRPGRRSRATSCRSCTSTRTRRSAAAPSRAAAARGPRTSAGPARSSPCCRCARSRASARAASGARRPRRPCAAAPAPRAAWRRRRDALAGAATRGPSSSGWTSASRSCRAAPRRSVVSSSGGGAARRQEARRDRQPARRQLRERRRAAAPPRAAGCRGAHEALDGARPQRAADVAAAAPHEREQEVGDERAHRHRAQPSRPHSGIGPSGSFSISTGVGQRRLRAGLRSRGVRRWRHAAPAAAARAAPATRPRRATAARRAPGNTTTRPLRGAQPIGEQLGRGGGPQPRPERHEHVGRRRLEQRAEREPLERPRRQHQDAAIEHRDA